MLPVIPPVAQAAEAPADVVQLPPDAPTDFRSALATVLESLTSLWEGFLSSLPQLVFALLILLGTWLMTRLVGRALRSVLARTRVRGSLRDLCLQLSTSGLWIGGLLLAATIVFPGVTPGKILTVLGLGSIAIGFAFKDIFENFFAGVLILLRFPMEKGDVIHVGDTFGRVESVTIRMTQIRMLDDQLVVLPNASLFKEPVRIQTERDLRRMTTTVGVAYGADADEARDVIRKAVEGCERVESGRPVQIFVQLLNASSVDFEVTWWSGSGPLEEREARDEVIRAVKRALDDAGIEIPFPQRTLTFGQTLRTERIEEPAEVGA